MLWEGAAVAGLEFFQPLAPVATQRLISGYALTEQKSFDTIDVSHSLGDERFALAAEVAAVFLVGTVPYLRLHRIAAIVGELSCALRGGCGSRDLTFWGVEATLVARAPAA